MLLAEKFDMKQVFILINLTLPPIDYLPAVTPSNIKDIEVTLQLENKLLLLLQTAIELSLGGSTDKISKKIYT
jgi:hypothetical protein